MTAQQRELLRDGILTGLDKLGEYRPTLDTLHLGLRQSGHQVTLDEVKTEVNYLVDKGFISFVEKAISPERRRHRITAAGRDYLAEEGLA
jgi:hypothetical protein